MATARWTATHPRLIWLIPSTTVWLLLASEISSEENASTLAQILGAAACSVLAAGGLGYLLRFLSKLAARLLVRAVRFISSRRRR